MTKEKLEQLGWEVRKFKNSNGLDMIEFYYRIRDISIILHNNINLTLSVHWLSINELQLILDYIKEQEK